MTITNRDIAPYFDDFDASKGFHQILFRPGYSVQARELTQIQSILRDQIAKFGNHIFKQGSVVIPGNSFADLATPYVKLQAQFSAVDIIASNFEGKIVVGVTNGIRAVVKKAVAATISDPVTLYLAYLNGGGTGTANEYLADEEIYVETDIGIRAKCAVVDQVGHGSTAFVNTGVFYVNDSFVSVAAQSIIISKYTSAPSCHVLLKIVESVVDSSTDETLLDPAQGSYNYAAPGADRIKIDLVLSTLALGATIDNNYVELMRFNAGVLEEHARYPKYSELEKSLARRTFDESGDYVVSGFNTLVRDALKTKYNNGVSVDGAIDQFVLDIGPGKAYIKGFEVETIASTQLSLPKARTSEHVKSKSVTYRNTYGKFLYVTDLLSLPNFEQNTLLNLYNDNDPGNGAATSIGTVRAIGIDYHAGDPSAATAIYKLYFTDDSLGVHNLSEVGGIRFTNGSATVLTKYTVLNATTDFVAGSTLSVTGSTNVATVETYTRSTGELFVYRHDATKTIPVVGQIILGSSGGTPTGTISASETAGIVGGAALFELPALSIKSTKNIVSGLFDITYTAWKTITINTNISGNGSHTITDGVFRTPDAGLTVAIGSAGVVALSKLSISSNTTFVITAGPASDTVVILTQVDKTTIQPKVKTLTAATLSAVTPATSISLGKADIYRITSILSGSLDVTDRYSLDNGQRDSHYDIGSINLVGTLPSSNLTIEFEYFTHTGTGDYCSIDSYITLGSNYIDLVPSYRSPSTSKIYDLSNYLDFRPRMADNGTYVGGTSSVNDMPVVDTLATTSVEYFVNRIDTVYIDKSGIIGSVRGQPDLRPIKPSVPANGVELFTVAVPAYTASVSDVILKKANNTRFTMADLNKLQNRVANVEYYSTLNAVENSLLSYEVPDAATGLNRFKTGYLVDNFENPFTICDYYNPQQRANFRSRRMSAAVETHNTTISLLSDSTEFANTNGVISLPYTEVPFITQATSTRVTNVNPFMVFAWTGVMTINPPSDSWVETEDLPSIMNNVDNVVTVTREERVEVPTPITPPAGATAATFTAPNANIPTTVPVSSKQVTAWVRDLGLSVPGDANWNETITFCAPAAAVDVFNSAIAGVVFDPVNNPGPWADAIKVLNNVFDMSTGSAGLVSGTKDRYAASDVIDFWTQGGQQELERKQSLGQSWYG